VGRKKTLRRGGENLKKAGGGKGGENIKGPNYNPKEPRKIAFGRKKGGKV